jgi:N-methylhydantoinase A/oxoprolinase/acetone carboxylase beta subunit
VHVRANRVVPISLMGARWPALLERLRSSLQAGMGMRRASRYLVRAEGAPDDALIPDLSTADRSLLRAVGEEPRPYSDLVVRASDRASLARLVDRGLVQVVGFTPSDAAHVLELQSQWSREAALLECLLVGRASGLISIDERTAEAEARVLAQRVVEAVVSKSAHLLLEKLAGQRFDVAAPLVAAVTSGAGELGDLRVALHSKLPVVAVGGPAAIFYPEVGARLGVETIVPQGSAVANAIGAAIGVVKARAVVEITRREDGAWIVHHEGEPVVIDAPHEALERALALAQKSARQHCLEMGGAELQARVAVARINLPGRDDDQALVAATVTAECTGAPRFDVD